MDKDYLIQTTNSLYRLTLLFPKKEPLRYRMRNLSNEIVSNLIFLSQFAQGIRQSERQQVIEISNKILKDFDILDSFFEIAKNQNWISPAELMDIQQSYNKIKEEYRLPLFVSSAVSYTKPKIVEKNPRYQKILVYLKERGKAQVSDLQAVIPDVSKRTIRRDFESLLKKGKVARIGERNETFYQLS